MLLVIAKYLQLTNLQSHFHNYWYSVYIKPSELRIRCVKLTSIDSSCVISSPNPIFDPLLESSQWDDSNKGSNIGFGEEIGILEMKIRTLSGALTIISHKRQLKLQNNNASNRHSMRNYNKIWMQSILCLIQEYVSKTLFLVSHSDFTLILSCYK